MIVKIQHRRGDYADYDPTKVLPGEIVIVQSNDPNSSDGKSIYVGTIAGDVRRLVTDNELESEIATKLSTELPSLIQNDPIKAEIKAVAQQSVIAELPSVIQNDPIKTYIETIAQQSVTTELPSLIQNDPIKAEIKAVAQQSVIGAIEEFANDNITIDIIGLTTLPLTINNPAIKSNHRPIQLIVSNQDAKVDAWDVNASDGSVTITGTISGSTDVFIYLTSPKTIITVN